MRHANVALFVPNNGCPHQCSFCSQQSITGFSRQPGPEDVRRAAETALKSLGTAAGKAEIAFFGGSFTAIDRGYMLSLLQAAEPYIRAKKFAGIRISTRPDYIDEDILSILKHYGVTTIELGAQSMDDHVLTVNGRGHTSGQVVSASKMIHARGFSLGLQMMTGLAGDSDQGAKRTAERLAALFPDCMRIYPTIVLRNTPLGRAYLEGKYRPQTLEEAVSLCSGLLSFFEARGIPVIRLGLHASPELEHDMLAGPWHPAFRELCENRRFLWRILGILRQSKIPAGKIKILVNPACISQAIGQKKENIRALSRAGYFVQIAADSGIARGDIKII